MVDTPTNKATNPNQRNMTIDLHIKTLSLKVTEHTPVYVTWQRGKSI